MREGAGGRLQEDIPGFIRRLVHLVRGCRPVPEFAVSCGRLVEIGRVCPVCGEASPLV